MNHHHQRMLATTRKRKDREDNNNNTTTSFYPKGNFGKNPYKQPLSNKNISQNANANNKNKTNDILAGYMAHEFLTKGTLFGQKFDPARAEAMPLSRPPRAGQPTEPDNKNPNGKKSYADVARLLKGDSSGGVHIPGVFNPTQLTRWIQM